MHDSFDEKIIQCLANNGRITINEIISNCSLTEFPSKRLICWVQAGDGLLR